MWCELLIAKTPTPFCFVALINSGKLLLRITGAKQLFPKTFITLGDIFFTTGMSLFTSLVFMKKLSDVNAQPKIFPRHFLSLLKNPPNDFSLDLYLLVVARFNDYKIIDYPVIVNKRISGEAKGGGGTFKNKIKLTQKTLSFILYLRKNFKKLIF